MKNNDLKRKPWLESEIEVLENNLHLNIFEMIKQGLLPNRTYWMIYNKLATMGYRYSFPKKRWFK